MSQPESELPVTPDLQMIFDRFARDYQLAFDQRVANLFEFIAQNSLRIGEDQVLVEEDLTAYIAEATELPICTNRTMQPTRPLMDRCAAFGLPEITTGHVPVMEFGPGIFLAHYDPFFPIPACFHKANVQIVLVTWATYKRLRESFNERYQPPANEMFVAPAEEMPNEIESWAEWQLSYNPIDERVLKAIRDSASFEDAPPEWEYWFINKVKPVGQRPCFAMQMVEQSQESKRIPSTTLRPFESGIVFENHRLMQLAHVLDWDRWNAFEVVLDQVRRQDLSVQTVTILPADYNRFLEEQINRQANLQQYFRKDEIIDENLVDEIDPTQFTENEPLREDDQRVRKMAELIIFSAYKRGASDILIEPQIADYRVRFTIDGSNHVFFAGMPRAYGGAIIAHLKVRASMDITERRLPQDGKITLQIKGKPLELRAATMPVRDTAVVMEEKMTLRLLSSIVSFPNLERINMRPDHLQLLRKTLSMANGIMIVTGPTGSGKTTTLYAAVQELDRDRLNVVSLEDPIETYIPGITQTQINDTIGLDFARGLRAILRQAPHVILLGEIRDREVANIAVQAANTGHLVLTTLHTNSAMATFSRLQALGAETHQIADAVRLIMAQRLIPRLCQVCRKSRKATEMESMRVEKLTGTRLNAHIFHANNAGCKNCHKGYIGRRILTEVIPVDGGIRDMLLKNRQENLPLKEIAEHATKVFKYRPLFSQAIDLVNEGQCDLASAQKLFLDFGE